jgi:serine acetyltransferase
MAKAGDLIASLRRDATRYEGLGGWPRNPGFWIGATYRLGVFARSFRMPLLRFPLVSQHRAIDSVCRTLFNVHISTDAKIGGGLCLIHARNIMVGPAEIGENCLIFHEVTIGTNANSSGAIPKIGNNVDIYVGARVLGRLVVGDDAKIGANCVVTKSVSPGAVVVPAANREVPASLVAAFGPKRSTSDNSVPSPGSTPPGTETSRWKDS